METNQLNDALEKLFIEEGERAQDVIAEGKTITSGRVRL